MKHRIGIVAIVALLLALVGAGLWAGSEFVYAKQGESLALVADVAATGEANEANQANQANNEANVATTGEANEANQANEANNEANMAATGEGDEADVAARGEGDEGNEANEANEDENEAGIVITAVEADSPAAKAGVKRGNILLKVDETEVNTFGDLHEHLESLEVGAEVTLNVLHGDEARTLTATTGERNGEPYLGITSCDGIEKEIEKQIEMILDGEGAFPGDFGGFGFSEFVTHTLIVEDVLSGEAAEAAGLQVGDQILTLDGQTTKSGEEFVAALQAHKPGESVTLTIQRAGEADSKEVQVTLGDNGEGDAFLGIGLGVEVEVDVDMDMDMDMDMDLDRHDPGAFMGQFDLDHSFGHSPGAFMGEFDFQEFDLPAGESLQGAVIAEVNADSPAAAAGLQKGDVITAIDGKKLDKVEDLTATIKAHQPGDTLTLSVWRKGESLEISATLGQNAQGNAQLGAQVGFLKIKQTTNGNQVEIEQEMNFDNSTE
ncbi:MAG: PDZ domain-containing protein [Ardenticatenaceae bacterium]